LVVEDDAEAPEGDVVVALLRADLSDGGPPVIGSVFQSTPIGPIEPGSSASFTFDIDGTPPLIETYVPDLGWPDFRIASYLVGAFVDRDGDGQPGPEDVLVGGSFDLLIYAEGYRDSEPNELTLPAGWHVARLEHDDVNHHEVVSLNGGDFDRFLLPANLVPSARPGLEVLVHPALGPDVRVDLYALTAFYMPGVQVASTLSSVAVDATAPESRCTFEGPFEAPADEHWFLDLGDTGFYSAEAALAAAVAYRDADGNERWDPGAEPALASSLYAGDASRMLVDLRPLDFTAAVYDELVGESAGWAIVAVDGDGVDGVADWDAGLELGE
jgi:hypothetical protein